MSRDIVLRPRNCKSPPSPGLSTFATLAGSLSDGGIHTSTLDFHRIVNHLPAIEITSQPNSLTPVARAFAMLSTGFPAMLLEPTTARVSNFHSNTRVCRSQRAVDFGSGA